MQVFQKWLTDAIQNNKNKMAVLIGPGGSGKSYCFRYAIAYCKQQKKKVRVYATTGIAATLLEGGLTVHHGFGVPAGMTERASSYLHANSQQGQDIKETDVIIIDEISQMNTHVLTLIDELLRNIMGKPLEPFGGKIIILGGDFRQNLPVIQRGTRVEVVTSCVITNALWERFQVVLLTKNMRAKGDDKFCDWLLKLGTGQLPLTGQNMNVNLIEIPQDMLLEVFLF